MFVLKGLEHFLLEDLMQFKFEANKELLKKRLSLHLYYKKMLFPYVVCLAMSVTTCSRETRLRGVKT